MIKYRGYRKIIARIVFPVLFGGFIPVMGHANMCTQVFYVSSPEGQPSEVLLNKFKVLQNELVEIKRQIKDGHPNAYQQVLDRDVRGVTFALQAILRMYTKSSEFKNTFSKSDREAIEQALIDVKDLEDHIGAYSLSKEILAAVKDKSTVDKDFIQFLERNVISAERSFHDFLKEEKWIKKESKKSGKLLENLEEVKWPSGKHDLKYIQNSLKEYVLSIEEKINNKLKPMILSDKYGFNELENGVHEWRRSLRWIPISLMALSGKFSYSKLPAQLNPAEQALVDKYQNSKFTRLNGQEGQSIALPPLALYEISKLISDIGKAKDSGEAAHYLTSMYQKFHQERGVNLSDSQARSDVEKLLTDGQAQSMSVEQRVHEIYHEFESLNPLKAVAEALRVK